MMRVLVTGGTGRIGGNLVRALIDKEYDVRVFALPSDRSSDKVRDLGAEIAEGDLRNQSDCMSAVKGTEAVYHLGAYLPTVFDESFYTRTAAEKTKILFEVNIQGTFNMLEAVAVECPHCKRFVFASTDATYPMRPRAYAVDENHRQEPGGGGHLGFYGVGKLVGETMVRGYQRTHGIPTVIFRFGTTIGIDNILSKKLPILMSTSDVWLNRLKAASEPSEDVRRAIRELEDKAEGQEKLIIPYHPDGWPYRSHICDVRDLAQGLILGLERDAAVGETFNLHGPSAFTFEEMIPYLSKATGIAYFKAVIPGPGVSMELSISKARSMLGYRPQYDVFRIIDDAIRFQKGEEVSGFVPRGEPSV